MNIDFLCIIVISCSSWSICFVLEIWYTSVRTLFVYLIWWLWFYYEVRTLKRINKPGSIPMCLAACYLHWNYTNCSDVLQQPAVGWLNPINNFLCSVLFNHMFISLWWYTWFLNWYFKISWQWSFSPGVLWLGIRCLHMLVWGADFEALFCTL